MSDGDPQMRRGLLGRVLLEVLRDAAAPLAAKDAVARVKGTVELNPHELSLNPSGFARFDTYLRFLSSWASAIGWMAKRGGWSITEAGVEAGWWTSYGDLADLTGLSPSSIGTFMSSGQVENGHRVLRTDGTAAPGFTWADPNRTDDVRQVLERESLTFDDEGRADPDQRITADVFREQLEGLGDESESTAQRAWLVRGSSVDGRDLVPVWLHRGSASLAGASLRAITPPVARDELKAIVEEDYQHKSYAVRETKLAEFDAFCNRMRVGDHVLTTTQGKTYVGRIAGDAEYVASTDQRSNLRRAVEWLNPTQPVPFARLPQPLPAKLHSQSDVVELTDDIAAVEHLLTELGIPVDAPSPTPARELRFPEISQELAEELLIDHDWLQRQADLLWDRKQLILYGPPGTGKTFLARKLAGHLAEPSAVKLVQFHPSYTYEDFFEGFRPVPRGDQLTFKLSPGPFRRLVDAARQHPSDPYILIIDEINRANLAKVFGELYFLLEYRDHPIDLLYSAESDFVLPPNVFVVGTMNTADRSIALVDAAMRRRFAFIELHPAEAPTAGLLVSWLAQLTKDEDVEHNLDAPQLLEALNARIEDRDLAIGPSYLMRAGIYRHADGLDRVWKTSILPLLAEHHYGSPPAVLDLYRLPALRAALAAQRPAPGLPP